MIKYDYGGRVVFVTGGGSGIGLAAVRAFSTAGARIAIADINAESGAQAAESLREAGGDAEAFRLDVSDEDAVISTLNAVAEKYGRIDVAINNAGIEAPTVPLANLQSRDWHRVINVNLAAIFYCLKAEIPRMVAQGGGVIVNTASISGLIAGYNLSAYTASKHGVIGLTKAAAAEYAANGVRINALCPGLVDTPFIAGLPQPIIERLVFGIPAGRPGKPEEMAKTMLWLCSDDASYVTGHAMVVDGGASLGAVSTRFDDLI